MIADIEKPSSKIKTRQSAEPTALRIGAISVSDLAIVVESTKVELPTEFAISLGFIVNELITNSAKRAKSRITLRLETTSSDCHSLTVSDDGPGLPAGFDPTDSNELG